MKQVLRRRAGQGMTEYIIIVALIAIAAIAAFTFFGDVVRGQVGGMAAELAGQDSSASKARVEQAGQSAETAGTQDKSLADFGSAKELQ